MSQYIYFKDSESGAVRKLNNVTTIDKARIESFKAIQEIVEKNNVLSFTGQFRYTEITEKDFNQITKKGKIEVPKKETEDPKIEDDKKEEAK